MLLLSDDELRLVLEWLDGKSLWAVMQCCAAWHPVARTVSKDIDWQASMLSFKTLLVCKAVPAEAVKLRLANANAEEMRAHVRLIGRCCGGGKRVPRAACPDRRVYEPEHLAQHAADASYIADHETVALLQRKAKIALGERAQFLSGTGLAESLHARQLPQTPNGGKTLADPRSWTCVEDGETLTVDCPGGLWLNLSDGHIGSGGQNSGGRGGAREHFLAVQHATGEYFPLVVKLGTVSPRGADVHSYCELDGDKLVTDPLLAAHLRLWGIEMQTARRTAATLFELASEEALRLGAPLDGWTTSPLECFKLRP